MPFLALEQVLQSADARGLGRALILTALSSEIKAVLAHLGQRAAVRGRDGMIYECGEFAGEARDWLVVVAQSGPGNQAAQAAAMTAHHDFDRFDVMMFVGVAGSRKTEVQIGSVVAANFVYSPYSGKIDEQGFSSRPRTFPTPAELVQLAYKVERDEQWQARILTVKGGLELGADGYPQPYPPTAHVAPIVSVEAVMTNPDSELERLIALHFGDAHGVEMEGFGAAFGASLGRTPAIVIRGISDMTARKKAKTDAVLQPIAVAHASAFAFELLSLLEPVRRFGEPPLAPPSRPDPPADPELKRREPELLGNDSVERASASATTNAPLTSRGAEIELQAARAELDRASHDLASWPQTLPGGERLDRPELKAVLHKLEELDSSATVVLGPPGSGKSALLARIAFEAAGRNWPVLGIKADILDPEVTDEGDLQRQLMLSELPSTMLSRLADFGPVVLIIDQLDALAGFVDVRTGRLNVLLHLIRRLRRRRNVHVIVSARTFEFNHDVRLRSIEADALELALPPWSEILSILATRDLNPEGWPPDAQETLRTPQHLATFLRLADTGTAEPFQNYQAMLERLWIERVLRARNGEHLASLATQIANDMAEDESLWVARSRYDQNAKDLLELERLQILTSSADGLALGFTHQTLYDYVLARSFVHGKGRLAAYVAGREASLFLRPKLWVALTYLRNVETGAYEQELTSIWESESLRPHLKLLLIEFMGQQKEPTETERRLMKPVLMSGADRPAAFRAIVGSPGWFTAVAGSAVATAMAESEQIGWLVTGVLQQAWAFAPERVLSLIEQHWAPDSRFDLHLWTTIGDVPQWSDAILALAVMVLQRTKIAHFHVEHVVAQLGVQQPKIALRLARAVLDRDLDSAIAAAAERAKISKPSETDDVSKHMSWYLENAPEKPLEQLLEQSQDWDVLTSLAEATPTPFMDAIWPWFIEVLQALKAVRSPEDGVAYPLPWKFDFRFEDEDKEFSLPPSPILYALTVAAENLAKSPEDLRSWLAKNLGFEAVPAQRLLAHALAQGGEAYAKDAFDYLMEDDRRFYLGNLHDQSGTTKALIRAASPYWSQDMRDAFVRRVRNYSPPAGPHRDARSKRLKVQALRRVRLSLLKALPQEHLDEDVKRQIRQESRVFGDEHMGVRSSGFGFIGSPMSTEAMLKASDEAILNAFREIPDRTEWDHPRHHLKGGNIQLSRAFAEFAKQQPQRAAQIIRRMEPENGSRASGYALDAIAEGAEHGLVLQLFLDLARRGFVGEEFRGSAARAIERLVEQKTMIDDEVLAFLQDWLDDAPEPSTGEWDSSDLSEREENKDGQDAHAILWDGRHFSILPHGSFPILETLTRVLIARDEHDRIIRVWERHLERREDPKVWKALLRLVPYIHPTNDAARARLLGKIFDKYPQVAESLEGVNLIASAHWWAPEQVRALLDSWRQRDDRWLQQVVGEVGGLIGLVQPELDWATDLLAEGMEPNCPVERRIGIAFSAANLWGNPKFRSGANEILLSLIPHAGGDLWQAILDIFRVVDEFGDIPETASLIDAVATHIHKAGTQTNTFLIDRLQGLLPEHADAIGRLVEGVIKNLNAELGDIRTGAAASAPALVDIAITLHRLGGPTRELGVQLFEELLRIDAYSARATLEEIDSRFRTNSYLPRRSRLPRHNPRARRGRRIT